MSEMTDNLSKERNSYIDLCRAIAVLDVLAGHTAFWVMFWETPNWLKSLTLLFEVPTFFFLSGWASSLRAPDFKKSVYGLSRFWLQWVYFVTVMAIVCALSVHTRFPFSGVEGVADLIKNYFFKVSFPGFSIVSISLWWVKSFFIVVPLFTLILSLFRNSRHKGALEVILCIACAGVFFWWSIAKPTLYTPLTLNTDFDLEYLFPLSEIADGSLDATIPFLGFFWLLGYNRKKIRIDKLWKLACSELLIIGAYLFSMHTYRVAWDDIQTAKFPPTAPYFFSSFILIFLMLYLEPTVKKTGRLLPHIGKNAPFYFFAQGVTSSICTHIKHFIPGADKLTLDLFAGFDLPIGKCLLLYLSLLVINIAMAVALAEAFAYTYYKIKRLTLHASLHIPMPIPVIILIFFMVMLFYEAVNAPGPFGEWDDYSFPVVSIIEEHRISITENTVASVKEWLYPDWGWMLDNCKFSGMQVADGGELPWYFPVYAIVCIPMVLIFRKIGIPPMHAFPVTNLIALTIAFIIMAALLKTTAKRRTVLLLLLAVHPAVFYISNISAEPLIYALLIIGCTFWYNRSYRPAALFISIAGMLNPTIMCIGIVMILEYLEHQGFFSEPLEYLGSIKKWLDLISYGVFFIPALIPMAYNYYHTGHINLTAATPELVTGNESTLARMWAYITDMNYGLLPYFPVLTLGAVVLIVMVLVRIRSVFSYAMPHRYSERERKATVKKSTKAGTRFMEWMIVFFINLALVSTVTHINSGMCGIARYNMWLSVIPIFAIILFGADIVDMVAIRKLAVASLTIGILFTGGIVYTYYPHFAMNAQYTDFTPIAKLVMDRLPGLYDPLPSTFVSRTLHIDGGYEYETPVIYVGDDNYVRKILATKTNEDMLLKNYRSATNDQRWINKVRVESQIQSLSDRPGYISVPGRYRVRIRDIE